MDLGVERNAEVSYGKQGIRSVPRTLVRNGQSKVIGRLPPGSTSLKWREKGRKKNRGKRL